VASPWEVPAREGGWPLRELEHLCARAAVCACGGRPRLVDYPVKQPDGSYLVYELPLLFDTRGEPWKPSNMRRVFCSPECSFSAHQEKT